MGAKPGMGNDKVAHPVAHAEQSILPSAYSTAYVNHRFTGHNYAGINETHSRSGTIDQQRISLPLQGFFGMLAFAPYDRILKPTRMTTRIFQS